MDLEYLKKRAQERYESHVDVDGKIGEVNLIGLASDLGVILNGGRSGARFAPEAVYHVIGKMAWHFKFKQWHWHNLIFSHEKETKIELLQQKIIKKTEAFFNPSSASGPIFIGGGHDHIYPILKAAEKNYKKIVCINIDAHADTRTDTSPHSGNPFRLFDQTKLKETHFELWQIGLHKFANTKTTLSPLLHTKEKLFFKKDLECSLIELKKHFEEDLDGSELLVFSLDVDAFNAGVTKAVSAVNHHGLKLEEVLLVLDLLLAQKQTKCFGFFEYNPVYDDLSQSGARAIAFLIDHILNLKN